MSFACSDRRQGRGSRRQGDFDVEFQVDAPDKAGEETEPLNKLKTNGATNVIYKPSNANGAAFTASGGASATTRI